MLSTFGALQCNGHALSQPLLLCPSQWFTQWQLRQLVHFTTNNQHNYKHVQEDCCTLALPSSSYCRPSYDCHNLKALITEGPTRPRRINKMVYQKPM